MNNSEGQTQEPVGGIHELKIWPEYFDDVESGKKNFEVRKLDRLFGVGDILHLREWSLIKGYSGRETRKVITYVMAGGQWGLSEGNCILGIATPPPAPIKTEGEENQMISADYWFEKSLHIPVAKKWQRFGHADIVKELIKEMMEYYATPPPSPVGIDLNAKNKIIQSILENANGSWIDMITEGFEAGCAFPLPVTGESEAIGFGEWISNNKIDRIGFDMWRFNFNTTHTTKQLFGIYKQSKK